MHLAIDIDDTITHAPEFFAALTHALPDAKVTIITFRPDMDSSVATLREHGVRFDRIVVSSDPQLGCPGGTALHVWKAQLVGRLGVDVYFDDSPEVLHLVKPPTRIFMCCDDLMRSWLASSLKRPAGPAD